MSGHVERPGLYVMVFFCLLNSCSASDSAREAKQELKRIADTMQQTNKTTNLP
jgi:hypothetical protein